MRPAETRRVVTAAGTQEGWNRRLQEKGLKLEGHRLVRRSEDEKEYMVKSGNST